LSVSKVFDTSKSPLKRETLIPVPPFLRGATAVLGSPQVEQVAWVRGDLKVPKVTAKNFSNNLLGILSIYIFGELG